MHLLDLIAYVRDRCGDPTHTDSRDDAYRWIIDRELKAPIHLCVTLEQLTGRASIWVLDGERPADSQTVFLKVENADELNQAIRELNALCPMLARA